MTAQFLADGPSGQALLAIERGQDARAWLTELTTDPVLAHPDEASLFEGAPAVAFTLAATQHQRPLAVLDQHVERITWARLEAAYCRMRAGELAQKREFDLISGLTGLGTYLLRRGNANELLREVVRYLVRLSLPRPDGLPGWWAADGPTGPGPAWIGGHSNHGMAHGIAGPLTLLALTLRRGLVVSGQAAAIDRICCWLDRWRCGTPQRAWWPEVVTRTDYDRTAIRQRRPHRPSWCYGTPGIARAQQIAGLALDDRGRQRTAESILACCATDEAQLTQLGDVSLCHGWAGLVHSVWRASQHNDELAAALPDLLDRLTRHLARQPPTQRGLLTGTAGVTLALRAAQTNTPPSTQWDACLLLNE
ncbi:lanthionine synthetase C family protein [Amycolatopsis sp. Poz14]|uniref:lanthionine synthetase C family protein n=1 Tax=Amycolatopsis sp. Poz14 TaxID=1447705 RepID=UPI001EE8E734|nr:lanthionine synthetase C family protein [Amycolatopsis sp. Poz14]MCG3755841.1 lanthionine synthetase C family protein [Amycolatopsis sp. Poz14]